MAAASSKQNPVDHPASAADPDAPSAPDVSDALAADMIMDMHSFVLPSDRPCVRPSVRPTVRPSARSLCC